MLREYGFDGVDIDLENGVNAQYLGQALRSLQSQFGSGLVITMAPHFPSRRDGFPARRRRYCAMCRIASFGRSSSS